jgi:hypothetical protein
MCLALGLSNVLWPGSVQLGPERRASGELDPLETLLTAMRFARARVADPGRRPAHTAYAVPADAGRCRPIGRSLAGRHTGKACDLNG